MTHLESEVGDARPIRVIWTVDDEMSGPVELTLALTREAARKVAGWSPGVARLYLGHDHGAEIQQALSNALSDLE